MTRRNIINNFFKQTVQQKIAFWCSLGYDFGFLYIFCVQNRLELAQKYGKYGWFIVHQWCLTFWFWCICITYMYMLTIVKNNGYAPSIIHNIYIYPTPTPKAPPQHEDCSILTRFSIIKVPRVTAKLTSSLKCSHFVNSGSILMKQKVLWCPCLTLSTQLMTGDFNNILISKYVKK